MKGSAGSFQAISRLAPLYFLLQSILIAAWWILIAWGAVHPGAGVIPFFLADAALVIASAFTALLLLHKQPSALTAGWITTGAAAYAFLYCLGYSAIHGAGWVNVALMLPPPVLSAIFTSTAGGVDRMFRTARPASASRNLAKTLAQMAVFWTVFLLLIPALIRNAEAELGVAFLRFAAQPSIGIVMFLASSALGVWSAFTMALQGAGTPLPIDSPRRLVTGGPYSLVRNPMAVAGVGQGIGVAIATGSCGTLLFALAGAVVWNYAVRPIEEAALAQSFGEEYVRYRRRVRCWWPRPAKMEA